MLHISIKRHLISLSPSSESLVPSIFPLLTRRMLLPCRAQPPFCPHLGICNRICVKLLQLMCAVITHNSAKKLSLCINKWLSYSQLVFHGRHLVRHLGICYWICVNLLQLMSGVITHNSVKKNEVSILING